jgi:dTDP-4-dehydrorhamnose reductase
MNNILITGGSGFLGGYLVKSAQTSYKVFTTYFKNKPNYPNINWIKIDLSNKDEIEKIIKKIRPDVIIHNAALTNADFCEENKESTKIINIDASEQLSKLGNKYNSRILYISTDLVFDGGSPPYSENAGPNPLSFYGWSKWQGELATSTNNPNSVIVRPAIMYGPPAILGTSFSEWMRKTWENGKETKLFIDQYRTTIFGGNLADAVIELAKTDFTGILHLAGSERINRYDFGIHLANQLNSNKHLLIKSKMSDVPLKGKRPADVSLNINLARSFLKTKFFNCKEGIEKAYKT